MVERPGLLIQSRKTREMLLSEGFDGEVIDRFAALVGKYKPAEETITVKPIEKKQLEFVKFQAIQRGDSLLNPGTPVSLPASPEQREKAFDVSEILRNKYIRRRKRKTQEQKAQEKAIYWKKRQTFFVKQNNWLQGEVDKDIANLPKPGEGKDDYYAAGYLQRKDKIPLPEKTNDDLSPAEIKDSIAVFNMLLRPDTAPWELTITEKNASPELKFRKVLFENGYTSEGPTIKIDPRLSNKQQKRLSEIDEITHVAEPVSVPTETTAPPSLAPQVTPKGEALATIEPPLDTEPAPFSLKSFSDDEIIRLAAVKERYHTGAFVEKSTEAKRLEVTRWEYQHHKLNEGFPRRREIARLTIEQPQAISLLEVTKKPNYARPEPKPAQRAEKSPTTLTPEQKDRLQKLDETIGKTPEEIPVFSWKPRNDRFTSRPMLPQRRRRRGRPSSGKAMSHTL